MSLINQMLRDLEQRRTADAGASALGGLSASGSATQSVNVSINYMTLATVVAALFIAGVVVAYLLGSQQQVLAIEGVETTPATTLESVKLERPVGENQVISAVVNEKPAALEIIETAPAEDIRNKPESVVAISEPETAEVIKLEVKEPDVDMAVSMRVEAEKNKSRAEAVSKQVPERNEQAVSKTVRPLTDEQRAQLAFQRAVKALGQGQQLRAQAALEEAILIMPAHVRARETLAAMFLNDGRVSEAASSLRDGLQLTPAATPLAKLYARILVDQGSVAEAVTVLERARPAVSADPDYYALLAALYRQENKHQQAAIVYQQILMQRPGVASWWMGFALSQDAMGETEQALDAFKRALRAGGLSTQVMQYIQSRIVALAPVVPAKTASSFDSDEFGE